MLPAAVVVSIAGVFTVGARRGFAMRTTRRTAAVRFGLPCWIALIGTLIGWELWQIAHNASTASALVQPLLAVPLVHVVVLVVWAWLGWELARK